MSCKTLDVTNGNKEKMASVLLKRGRMILKKRYDSRKNALRNSLFKATVSGWDSHKALEDVNTANQNELNLPNNNLATTAGVPTLKEAIKLEDKLISGEEIEFCPAYRIDSRHTECTTDGAVERLTNEDSRQSKVLRNESSKFYTNNLELNKAPHNPSDKSPIIAEDYPKLYITVTDTSDKDTMAKSSLLKSIRSIQNVNGNSYGINISNSRFFVPKDYIFSGVESAMNDLKFEVDPEMGRLLQRSYSSPQVNTSSSTLINIDAGPSSSDNTTETLTVLNNCADSDLRSTKALSDSSVCVKSKESDKGASDKDRLFSKKQLHSESKSNRKIINSILDETTSKSKTIVESQTRNHAESLDESDNCRTHENEEKSQEMRYEDHESSLLEASHLKNETEREETSCNNQLWTAKHVVLDEDQITTKFLSLDAMPENGKVSDMLEESKISILSDENIETNSPRSTNIECEKIRSSHDILSVPLIRQKSYPLLTPSEIAYRSRYLSSIPIVSSDTPGRILGIHSEKETEISQPLKYSINQEKQNESACSEQGSEYSNPSETNHIKFLQSSKVNENNFQIEKATPSESVHTMSEESKVSQSNGDLESDQPPMGRASSIREKFETIVEDVELRTLPGRRPQISESCDRKSLS